MVESYEDDRIHISIDDLLENIVFLLLKKYIWK